MQIRHFVLFVFLLFASAYAEAQKYDFATYEAFDGFAEKHLENLHPDTAYVLNFWATWCGPCVKELPYFEELHAFAKTAPVKVTLVTIDLPMAYESSLLPFLRKQNLQAEVVGLRDGDANSWIDRIDPSWSGAIPITLIIKNGKTSFYEKAYHSLDELQADIERG
ncbi:MAG: TlpA disulfide reductase family protein [Saprospiraceae bacterium]